LKARKGYLSLSPEGRVVIYFEPRTCIGGRQSNPFRLPSSKRGHAHRSCTTAPVTAVLAQNKCTQSRTFQEILYLRLLRYLYSSWHSNLCKSLASAFSCSSNRLLVCK